MSTKSTKLNEKQVAIVKALGEATTELTLAEISKVVGFEVKSGTTNSLVKSKVIEIVGEKTITCAVCGHKHTVKTYKIVKAD